MTDTTTESDAEKGSKGNILVFPAKLRTDAKDGAAHVKFKALDKDNIGPSVHLFVPQGFSVPDAANYGTIDLGMMGAFEAAGLNKDNQQITEADIKGNASSLGTIIGTQIGGSGGTVGAALGGMSALREGLASNPYTETQFNNSNIRSFGFTFKLVSESAEEAETALAIENFFRDNMYPELAGVATIKYPNKFQIQFFNGGKPNKYMPLIDQCYLATFNTTYNSTGNSFHKDGQPVEIDIACTFQETKPLTKTDFKRMEAARSASKTDDEEGED